MVRLARFACRIPDRSLWQARLARIAVAAGLFMLVAGVRKLAQTLQTAKSAPPAESPCSGPAPAFTQLTYDENNWDFSNPNCLTEFLDRIKFIPLRRDDENYYLSFGIFPRDRGDYYSHPELGSCLSETAYLLRRYVLLHD